MEGCTDKFNMGRVARIFRFILCWTLSLALPVAVSATDSPTAILHSQGGVWVNGKEVPDSTAIFSGDVLETRAASAASLDTEGSTVLIKPESVATFHGDFLTLDHGSVSVGSAKQFRVKVNCLTVVPVQAEWTQYDVTDVSGRVNVAAHKHDVNIQHESAQREPASVPEQSGNATVREGEEKSHDESEACGAAQRPGGAGSTLNAKWIYEAAGGAGAIILLLLHGGGGGKPSASPSTP